MIKRDKMYKINVKTGQKKEFMDITARVQEIVSKEGKNGICFVYVPHTTCGLTINENADPAVKTDIKNKLEELVPENDDYLHMEGNSDAHIKSSILGHSLQIFVENSLLQLGTWQGIFLCEFDGPRNREVWIKIID
jgi:secondary thiamine-phosphate synthase enzyme